ncbi:MAG: HNH endonuclease [Hyphomicrobiales bacterium]|nr:HNH endonuclease [Hyphomicrobiales bacterium]
MEFELRTLTDYSDDSLLAELRRVASEYKGERLTHTEFNRLSRVHSSTLRARFGSWGAALDRAEVSEKVAPRTVRISRDMLLNEIQQFFREFKSAPRVEEISERLNLHKTTIPRKFGKWPDLLKEVGLQPVPLGKRYTNEECLENILKLWTHYGRQPHFHELNRPPSLVGSKAYVLRWGGWRNALKEFVNRANTLLPTATKSTTAETLTPPIADNSSTTFVSSPRSLSLAMRYKILCRDHFRCKICGRSPAKDLGVELHVDHIVPRSSGGENTEENLRVLCFDCNLGKGVKREVARP